MIENLDGWLNWLLSPGIEGGVADRDFKSDPGGYTKYGCTVGALSDYLHRECTAEDVAQITLETARDIATVSYWGKAGCDFAPGGLDWCLADFAFHSHPRTAVRHLQALVGLTGSDIDGYPGPITQQAIQRWDTAALIEAYLADRLTFLQSLSNWPQNKNGWERRLRELRVHALKLAPAGTPVALVAQDHQYRKVASWVMAGGSTLLASLPLLLAAYPVAKIGADQVAESLPQEIAADIPWLAPAIWLLVLGAGVFQTVRGNRMAAAASATGAAAAVVVPK